jgi:argininosuccinate lyase
MQEDKEQIFDAIDTVKMCLPVFSKMLATMRVRADKMLHGAKGGFTNATDVADYLVKHGLPFRDAHGVVGRMVAYCIEHKKTLETLSLDEYHIASPIFEEDVYKAIDPDICVAGRACYGGPAPERVLEQIEDMRKYLNL